jgi:hypothetical protein
MKKIKALARKLAGFVLAMLLVFVVLDGLAGLVVIAVTFVSSALRVPVGGRHAAFDPELGWVNAPSFARRDFYGPGADLHQNARGFREDHEIDPRLPPDKLRVLCSGDSFTFGSGVGDDHTFARLLGAIEPAIETVNLGVTAYGVDQAYLFYRREGVKLDHDVHLFSFIRDDFRRMTLSTYDRAGKPLIRLRDGVPVVENVPVPARGFSMPALGSAIAAFRASHIAALPGLLRGSTAAPEAPVDPIVTALVLFEELQKIEASRGATLVLMAIPVEEDLDALPMWQRYLAAELATRGIPFIDLTSAFQALPRPERRRMYLRPGEPAPGHLSNAGNALVAKLLREQLAAIPAVAAKRSRLR